MCTVLSASVHSAVCQHSCWEASTAVLRGVFPGGSLNQCSHCGLSEQLLLMCGSTSLCSEGWDPSSAGDVFSFEEGGLFQSLS